VRIEVLAADPRTITTVPISAFPFTPGFSPVKGSSERVQPF
jgi:hypothetical protein